MIKKIIFILAAAFIIEGCAKVPLSGRRQLSIIGNSEILPMSYEQYDQVKAESNLVTNTAEGQMVVNAGNRIAKAVETYLQERGYDDVTEGFAWEFHLIESDQINAWAMPGGKVAFYTGIMPIAQNETGVAVIMGHEVAHAIANHARERMSQGLVANGLVGGLQVAMGQNPSMTQQIFLQAVGYGGQVGMLKFSRDQELEADELGLTFMAIAGYDPREAPVFWQRMEAAAGGGQRPPEFLSTHPGPNRRIEQLNKMMPDALEYYNKNRR
ncbi:M48 family metallopeptidase [Litoribacter ruber]|uniref:M48 family metallopeptidase n=1 Tax=Litoribacter ruber TaxID=702568 RepID=A0AAP2CEW4_9BACT|nr:MULTISPECIES: M48 family metallopeptidase [Litoribacter]MBS9523276.1 M48 family metallopeptidase [Litoribacter alkaliphilus]MBT0810561.1 M48 family metallopeptidase [Litoribacter ruber]